MFLILDDFRIDMAPVIQIGAVAGADGTCEVPVRVLDAVSTDGA